MGKTDEDDEDDDDDDDNTDAFAQKSPFMMIMGEI